MKTDGKRFRKRPHQAPGDRTFLSSTLRQIGEHIQKRDFEAGLSKTNAALADADLTGVEKFRVLSLVADSEFKRGRFAEAAQIQLQAATKSVDHATLWLRPHIGHVRALLKIPDVDLAITMAHQTVAVAEAKMADFDEQVRLAGQSVDESGAVPVPPVPLRVSVVATRMGYLFLQEGEPEAAEEFFNKAIQSTKGGANRARQGLARIALAKGEFGKAHRMSADAILRGGFKAKTRSAWITLIAARRQLPGWRISDRLIKGLDSEPAELRARTILTIVRELRKSDMRQWREIAERWSSREGARFPVVEAEIRKLVLASAKMEPGSAPTAKQAALQLLQTPGISPKEWIYAAKEWVRSNLWEGSDVQVEQLITTAKAEFDPGFVPIARHSLALSCMMADRYDLARPILRQNVQEVATDQNVWGKSVWALARMESMLGDHATAAALYRQYFDETAMPVRFRLQAQLLWCQELIREGNVDVLTDARALVATTLSDVQDPEILMNFARQLVVTVPELEGWGQEIFRQGAAIALSQYEQATHPSVAIAILFKLTRRQVYDFGYLSEAIRFWEDMSQDKVMWLWNTKTCFWEYLGLLLDAYLRTGQIEKAEAFLHEWVEDPATPPEGRVQIGIPYGIWLAGQSKGAEALALFDRLTGESPNHPLCGYAWYWKALAAHKLGDMSERDRCATCVRSVQGLAPIQQSKWHLDAKALLLLAGLHMENIDSREQIYPPEQMESIRDEMVQEMAALP
ncbi:MAG: tetratricopeptide repeat protein [Kiritimatiellia bacterium]